ncbi:MAG TPA: 6-carboxytetrahydropterin synthase [Spirochaetota bacterium]|nr:6-carboxytetrahydropterin synthase [Spirochaetota bacterium]HOL56172.1 6-carboxytetrahydropterin synthase [Spirochaetota bacterium]
MELTLYTEDYFDSSHFLLNYDGKCGNIHGHTWKICLWVKGDSSQLDNSGILWDFNNLKKIVSKLDHKNLNEIFNFSPSVENISLYIYQELKQNCPFLKFRIRIYEKIVKKESYCELGDF